MCHKTPESLREKFSWPVFCRTRAEYGDLHSKSPYSARVRENTGQEKLRTWTLFTQCICFKKLIWNSYLV